MTFLTDGASIWIKDSSLHKIKRELKRLYPDAKSSHRIEAFARSINFNSYNHLLAEVDRLQDDERVERTFSETAYLRSLAKLGARL